MANEQPPGQPFQAPRNWRKYAGRALLYLGIFLFVFWGHLFGHNAHISQAELLQKARQGQVAEVVYEDDTHLIATLKGDPTKWEVTYPKVVASETFKALSAANVPVKPDEGLPWGALIFFVFISALATMLLAPLRAGVDKLLGKIDGGTRPATRFSDVKGLPEVIDELKKFVDVLKFPDKYKKLGARLPAGVVIYGPPGTGKTLLAMAVAGEAGVPFYEVTGSSVRSMWIGKAGKAIKEYFDRARRHPVSILFFDEGDTIGGKRGDNGGDGGDDEHRAMVNELLAQMNPNRPGGKVFVIIATNDPQLLDEALTRPGRIDLHLAVLPPDVNGRREILELHTKGKPLAADVDLDVTARETYGESGAGLEALMNNAALEAGARGSTTIATGDIEHALTVMRSGPARKDLVVNDADKRITAHHEAGHAMCAAVLDKVASPTGITILAHGSSGGHTMAVPDERTASHYTSVAAAKQQLVVYMGGQAAEKLLLDADFTNAAASDRERATELAVNMICQWGMGSYNTTFGRDWRTGPHADEAWRQVEALLDEAELTALNLLLKHKAAFDELVARLLEQETLRASDLEGYAPAAVGPEELEQLKQRYAKVLEGVQARADKRHASTTLPRGHLATTHA